MKSKILIIIFLSLTFFAQSQDTNALMYYIKLGLENNPKVKTAYNDYLKSAEQIKISKSLPNPTISFAYAITPIQTRLGPQIAKISLTQMFPWFGTLSAKEKISAQQANAKYNLFIQQANETAFEISKVYWEMFFFYKELEILKHQIQLLKSLEEQSASKLRTGETNAVDLLTFQMAIDQLTINLDNAQRDLQQKQKEFITLLATDTLPDIKLPDTIKINIVEILPLDSVLNKNAIILAKRNLTQAAEENITLSRRITKPSIGLGMDYAIISGGNNAFMPMLSLSLPIYFGKNKAIKKQAQFNLQQNKENLSASIDILEIQYDKWQKDYINQMKNLSLYDRLIDKANQALNILYAGYSSGNADYLKTITMENNLLNYQLAKLKTLSSIKILEAQYNLLLNNFLPQK